MSAEIFTQTAKHYLMFYDNVFPFYYFILLFFYDYQYMKSDFQEKKNKVFTDLSSLTAEILTLVMLNLDIPWFCKQCRSR